MTIHSFSRSTTFLFFSLLFTSICFGDEILSAHRRTTWDPGIPGGIPQIQGPVENVLNHGADPSGSADSRNAVIRAIEALPATGGVVYIPQGIYLFKNGITIQKSGVVIRGEGVEHTRLLHDHTDPCFFVLSKKQGTWQTLIDGYQKGSNTITAEDGGKFRVGAFAEIQQKNDSLLMYTSTEWIQSWAENSLGQLFEITKIEGNEITFRTPSHYTIRSDLSPQIRPQELVSGVGFEDFYIERIQGGNSTLQFENAAYCWARNIESYRTQRAHIRNRTTMGCEFRDSYFHHAFTYGGGGSGYGVELGYHVTDGLCENNVFDSLRHSMMVHLGAVGCVFGYNYSINPVQGDGESNLNERWIPPDISLHGHYAQMNLFESNIVQEIGISGYWGPMGPGNTFLRNVIQSEGISIFDNSHEQNLIGNISTRWLDDGTSREILRHGEKVGSSEIWDSTIQSTMIPHSYYHTSKPDFYGSMEWPSIGIDKPMDKIPASVQWESKKGDAPFPTKALPSERNPERNITVRPHGGSIILDIKKELQGKVEITLTDLSGKTMDCIDFKGLIPGSHQIQLNKRTLSSGIYIFRFKNNDITFSQKLRIKR